VCCNVVTARGACVLVFCAVAGVHAGVRTSSFAFAAREQLSLLGTQNEKPAARCPRAFHHKL
jgi:hypothetical protein